MSALRFKPRRRLRSELLPLVSVVSVSLAVVGLFPRGLGRYAESGRGTSVPRANCALVTLTQEQEDAALAAARTSWQSDNSIPARRRVEVLPVELPEIPFSPAVDLSSRPPVTVASRVRPEVRVLPPTAAAAAPVRLPQTETAAPRRAFPRQLLLQLQ